MTNRLAACGLLMVVCTHFSFTCHRLRVISEIRYVKLRAEVVFVARERGRPEMTSQFDSFWSILYRCSVDILRLALSVKK